MKLSARHETVCPGPSIRPSPSPALGQFATSLWLVFLIGAINAVTISGALAGPKVLPGPIMAVVERVVDGDTIDVRARVWLDMDMHVRVRLADIDAPELRSRCELERLEADALRVSLARELTGARVTLHEVQPGKYHGRVIAQVRRLDGSNVGQRLLSRREVARYGTRRRCRSCSPREVCRRYFGMLGVAIAGR